MRGAFLIAEQEMLLEKVNCTNTDFVSLLRAVFETCPMPLGVVELVENDILHVVDNPPSFAFFRSQGSPEASRPVLASELGVLPETIAFWTQKYRESEKRQEPVRWLYKHPARDGADFWFQVAVNPVEWEGRRNRFLYVIEDVTEQKNLQEQLMTTLLNVRDSSQEKSDFLRLLSHELRTPVTAVLGFCGLLQSGSLPEDRRLGLLKRLCWNARELERNLTNIDDFSRSQEGKTSLEMEVCLVFEILEQAKEKWAALCCEKGLELKLILLAPKDLKAVLDRKKFLQILNVLVENAVKYTYEGAVSVELHALESLSFDVTSVPPPLKDLRQIKAGFSIDVVDSGEGISETKRAFLFSPFSQAQDPIQRKHSGLGLNLFLSRELARKMGGDVILISSEINKGSRFRALLPTSPY